MPGDPPGRYAPGVVCGFESLVHRPHFGEDVAPFLIELKGRVEVAAAGGQPQEPGTLAILSYLLAVRRPCSKGDRRILRFKHGFTPDRPQRVPLEPRLSHESLADVVQHLARLSAQLPGQIAAQGEQRQPAPQPGFVTLQGVMPRSEGGGSIEQVGLPRRQGASDVVEELPPGACVVSAVRDEHRQAAHKLLVAEFPFQVKESLVEFGSAHHHNTHP